MDRVRQRRRRPDRERSGDHLDGQVVRRSAAAILAVAAAVAAWRLHGTHGREGSFTALAGFAFGILLQRSRFCLASAFRDLFLKRERRMMAGLLVALAVGCVGYVVVMGARVPDPIGARYSPVTAHITPAAWPVLLGGLAFGAGMIFAGGCFSAHLWRLGEGSLLGVFALAGAVVGFNLAFQVWNRTYLDVVSTAPAVWLPRSIGYSGLLIFELALFGGAAVWLLKSTPPAAPQIPAPLTARVAMRRVFVEPWPAWLGGAAIGILATFVYLRTNPLTVSAEIGRLSKLIGLAPARLEGLDVLRGCSSLNVASGLTENAIFVLALVAGSLAAALAAGEFKPRVGTGRSIGFALLGGVLLGFGAMISLGCTFGTMLSGIMAGSLSGWIFLAGLLGGTGIVSFLYRRMRI